MTKILHESLKFSINFYATQNRQLFSYSSKIPRISRKNSREEWQNVES